MNVRKLKRKSGDRLDASAFMRSAKQFKLLAFFTLKTLIGADAALKNKAAFRMQIVAFSKKY